MTTQERFEAFHNKHPEVYTYIVWLCRDLKGKGFHHYGVRPLWERARWHFTVEKTEEFKLNNNYHSRYARKIMAENSDLTGFFNVRELRERYHVSKETVAA